MQVRAQAPLETGEEALLHACHFHGRLVARDHQLFACLVQCVEDMEEHILCLLLAGEELHVVDEENVHHLIELREVTHGIVLHRFDELLRELLGRNVEDRLVRMVLLDLDADGMREMRLTQTYTTVDQQRIEGCASRLLRNGITGTAGQSVAIPFDERIEGIVPIEVAFDLDLPQTGNDERVLDGAVGHIDRQRHGGVLHLARIAGRHLHGVRVGILEAVLHDDGILQTPFITQFLFDDLLEEADVMFLQPFVEELRWHLDGQHMILQTQSLDRVEPGLETLLAYVVLDDFQAPIPDLLVVLLHGWVSEFVGGTGGLLFRADFCGGHCSVRQGGKYGSKKVKNKSCEHLQVMKIPFAVSRP